MISCIVLSAGLSQRFGSPKALAQLNGETVIGHLQQMLLKTQVSEIIVVLGAQADQIKPHLLNHKKVKLVYNKNYNFGQTSSFKEGLKSISGNIKGVMLLPVDYPLIQKDTVDCLIKHFLDHSYLIVVPTFKEKKGHPPLFSISLRDEFLSLDNEKGLNMIAHDHPDSVDTLPVKDAGVIKAFNTKKELEGLKQAIERQQR